MTTRAPVSPAPGKRKSVDFRAGPQTLAGHCESRVVYKVDAGLNENIPSCFNPLARLSTDTGSIVGPESAVYLSKTKTRAFYPAKSRETPFSHTFEKKARSTVSFFFLPLPKEIRALITPHTLYVFLYLKLLNIIQRAKETDVYVSRITLQLLNRRLQAEATVF